VILSALEFSNLGNVLLKLDYRLARWVVKIADFGLSKFMKSAESTTTYIGTPLYEGILIYLTYLSFSFMLRKIA
jgi:serine/threonine protein kinase